MTKILIVDDHSLLRLGLIEAIESYGEMEVIADVSNGKEALEAFEKNRPDVIIMDMRMPEANGAEVTQLLVEKDPEARILILSVYEGEEDVWRAVEAGASGYLTKGADTPDLLEAITSVARGENYFPARIAQKIKRRRERHHLTNREIEALQLLVRGLSNKEISSELNISEATVKLHLSNLFEKLGVADRTQAVVAAVQRGILHLDD